MKIEVKKLFGYLMKKLFLVKLLILGINSNQLKWYRAIHGK
ncbi:hypothetical protein HMPREF0548_1148 [Lactobacillus ultunensis DSM 16047]|uniref:Uncharacterized protein n=1 Tax=Lactobacillus ultunensis DSM 16047 TaxID=525365 RepID=C2ENA2_9LACO|nr:hypothetical protein HMPREF0548_1148 [Lactobacillus ultunensis DSM 16047]